MAQEYASLLLAHGKFAANTGTLVTTWAAGVAFARTGKGVYTATLDGGGVDTTQSGCTFAVSSATPAEITVVDTSDTVKTITCIDAAAAAIDIDGYFQCWKAPLA